jgi:hypothetical protein
MVSELRNPTNPYVMYTGAKVGCTLNQEYTTPYHLQAQWAEYTKLKEIIGQLYQLKKRPLKVFDIGIGFARIPLLLRKVKTWNKIDHYTGIEISPYCIARSRKAIAASRKDRKVQVVRFNALDLLRARKTFGIDYDLVLCTYFTAGNFKPDEIQLRVDKNGRIIKYDASLLNPNEDFVSVFKGAFGLLRKGGKIFLGSVYCDTTLSRRMQEQIYERCGMKVITSSKDIFSATKEGFWSERFNKERIREYLSWISPSHIETVPLDDYNFANAIIINK